MCIQSLKVQGPVPSSMSLIFYKTKNVWDFLLKEITVGILYLDMLDEFLMGSYQF